MQYRRLGQSNLRVSALCLGTMMFGGQTPFDEARNIVASARERGINFIDTADIYNRGGSERDVGRLLSGQRDEWVVASKLGFDYDRDLRLAQPSINRSRYSRRWLIAQTDAILARLGMEELDVLYLHRDYHDENLEEAVRALGDLTAAGKIRGFGLSNFRGWRIAEVVRLCDRVNVPRPVVCQPLYNLLNREAEVEVLPACGHYGLGVVTYSPLARGVLTGKYPPGHAPAEGTRAARGDRRILETEFRDESLQIAQQLAQRCHSRGQQPGHFASAWILANPLITSVIAGPRTLAHLEAMYGALDTAIDDDDEALIDALVSPGHASTPGYNDPGYPFFGRNQASSGKR